jgi:hypothetical protein
MSKEVFRFDLNSYIVGTILASVMLGHISYWWALLVPPLLLRKWNGPMIAWTYGRGWEFRYGREEPK